MTNLEVAKNIIMTNLSANLTSNNTLELWEIRNGNKELLLEHIKALKNIFTEAQKELEKEMEE